MDSDREYGVDVGWWRVAAGADGRRFAAPAVGKGADDRADRILPGVADDGLVDGEPIGVCERLGARGAAHVCPYAVRLTVPFFW